jgi:hypothetical protein
MSSTHQVPLHLRPCGSLAWQRYEIDGLLERKAAIEADFERCRSPRRRLRGSVLPSAPIRARALLTGRAIGMARAGRRW